VQAFEKMVERGKSGAPAENALEVGAQFAAAARRGVAAIRFEVGKNHQISARLCGAVKLGEEPAPAKERVKKSPAQCPGPLFRHSRASRNPGISALYSGPPLSRG
jgi:hypothetical protein